MRTIAAVTIAMMITSTAAASGRRCFSDSAAYAGIGAAKVAAAYTTALASTNRGIVESALAHVAMIALTIPDADMSSAKARVAEIEAKGGTEEVRYKAWVVRMSMENPNLFTGMARTGYEDPDALFAAMASRLAEYYADR